MNLGRAKNILICAFLGLNIFLAYQLFEHNTAAWSRTAFTARELAETEQILAQKGYILEAPIGRGVRRSHFLTVSPDHAWPDKLAERFIGPGAAAVEKEDYRFYRGNEAELRLYPSGLARLSFAPGLRLAANRRALDEQELLRLVDRLLEEEGLKPEQSRFDYLEGTPGEEVTVHYYQEYNGIPLFAGYLKAFVKGERLTAMEFYWLQPAETPREPEMEVIPATEALLRLAEELGGAAQPRRIVKAELGFFSREYAAEKWEVPPVWRFLMDDGKAYHINAFTGILETDPVNQRAETGKGPEIANRLEITGVDQQRYSLGGDGKGRRSRVLTSIILK